MRILWAFLIMLAAGPAMAQSTIIYDRDGEVRSVIRQGPSGPIVYDRDGRIESAERRNGRGVGIVIRLDRRIDGSFGTTLRGGVGER